MSLCAQEQVEETHIMVKPDAVLCGMVSFNLFAILNKPTIIIDA